MKTKLDYANTINHKDNLVRTIVVNHKLDLKIGDLYDNQEKIESWSDSTCTENFHVEQEGIYEYSFFIKNVECHKVNYGDEEECEVLDSLDCENEGECLVLPNKKFKIIDVATDEDFKEMGYYEVNLEEVK